MAHLGSHARGADGGNAAVMRYSALYTGRSVQTFPLTRGRGGEQAAVMRFPALYIGRNVQENPLAGYAVSETASHNWPVFVPFSERKSIRGSILDDTGGGLANVVLAIDRQTYRVWTWTTSSALDGSFNLRPPTARPTLIVHLPAPGSNRNAVALDNITPVNN